MKQKNIANMTHIRVLPQKIINQIAAGEVIDRPAFAVKELVENSLDAGATSVIIDLADSGISRIKVTDNGSGIDQEDLSLALHPHATSKLMEDNLSSIFTLGFRGEALASIAAISRISIHSRTSESLAGYMIHNHHDTDRQPVPVGMPVGTTIECEGLFSPVPARKKFLKSSQTELRLCVDMVTSLALAHPEVRFELNHNGRQYFATTSGTLLTRINDLLGESVSTQLVPITYEESYLNLTGYIGKPSLTAPTSNKIWVFINYRPVTDKLINLAIKEAFASLLDPHLYPVAILNLTVPFEVIDVNVHPRKQEIRFVDSRFIFDNIKAAITKTLEENNLTFGNQGWQPHDQNLLKETSTYIANELKQQILSTNPLAKTQHTVNDNIFQVHNSYLMVQVEQGIILIDQHAAHERVLYEQFKKAYKDHDTQALPCQILLDLTLSESLLLDENLSQFSQLGFTISKTDTTKYLITTIPNTYKDRAVIEAIHAVLERLELGISLSSIDLRTEDLIHFLACKGAVKAGDPLTQPQMHELYDQLANCSLPYTCPHGRPTHVFMGLDELGRLFKRSFKPKA